MATSVVDVEGVDSVSEEEAKVASADTKAETNNGALPSITPKKKPAPIGMKSGMLQSTMHRNANLT